MDRNQTESRQKQAPIERIMGLIRSDYPLNTGTESLRKLPATTRMTPHLDVHPGISSRELDVFADLSRWSFQAERVRNEAP